MRVRTKRFHIAFVVFVLLAVGPALFASANTAVDSTSPVVNALQEESPYQPPDIDSVDAPAWLEPFAPLALLPLWGQAAVLSAGVASLFFVLPMVARWVWKLGEDEFEPSGGSTR